MNLILKIVISSIILRILVYSAILNPFHYNTNKIKIEFKKTDQSLILRGFYSFVLSSKVDF